MSNKALHSESAAAVARNTDWSDDTTVVQLTPQMLAIIEQARAKYVFNGSPTEAVATALLAESGLVRIAKKLTDSKG